MWLSHACIDLYCIVYVDTCKEPILEPAVIIMACFVIMSQSPLKALIVVLHILAAISQVTLDQCEGIYLGNKFFYTAWYYSKL